MKQPITTRITKYCLPGVSLIPRDGYYQIRKIGLSAERVRNDPAFANTRKQAARLSAALKIAHQLQAILRPLTGIKRIAQGLTGIVKNTMAGHPLQEAEGFDLNPHALWKDCVAYTPYCRYCHQQQLLGLYIPAHIPATALSPPPAVTHYRVIATLIRQDEKGHIYNGGSVRSSAWPLKQVTIGQTVLKQTETALQGHKLWVFIHLQWYLSDSGSVALRKSEMPGPLILVAIIKY